MKNPVQMRPLWVGLLMFTGFMDGERVFAAAGSAHAVSLEPALEATLTSE